ncbi:Transcription factor SFP1 [Basidiobolus ranarum]|uniref:Transcription factor SFP1 n=1 Tax=Basidiobolus ranarum TaxID=34480 RepID=A0ABR2WBD3_9FUNG
MPAPLDYSTHKSPKTDSVENVSHFDADFPQPCETLSKSINSPHAQDLEASFCRNFTCCGLTLDNLHDLLQHFEECHIRLEGSFEEEFSTASESETTSTPPYNTDQTSFLSLKTLLQSDITDMNSIYSEDTSKSKESYYSDLDCSAAKTSSNRAKSLQKQSNFDMSSSKRKLTIQPRGVSSTSLTTQPDELFPILPSPGYLSSSKEQSSYYNSKKQKSCSTAEKPYKCLVSGCNKTYKNPNGLKYHTQHGHCTNSGKKRDTSTIKPYHCAYPDCEKSYKNLNGLKYHIEHTHTVSVPSKSPE